MECYNNKLFSLNPHGDFWMVTIPNKQIKVPPEMLLFGPGNS
jgi:hypothetical protein